MPWVQKWSGSRSLRFCFAIVRGLCMGFIYMVSIEIGCDEAYVNLFHVLCAIGLRVVRCIFEKGSYNSSREQAAVDTYCRFAWLLEKWYFASEHRITCFCQLYYIYLTFVCMVSIHWGRSSLIDDFWTTRKPSNLLAPLKKVFILKALRFCPLGQANIFHQFGPSKSISLLFWILLVSITCGYCYRQRLRTAIKW